MCWKLRYLGQNGKAFVLSACAIQTSELSRCCTLHCRQIYIETILWWWEDLIWHVALAPFFPFIFLRTNQSCFCGDYWVCLSFAAAAAADMREICRATNQQDDVFFLIFHLDFFSSHKETALRCAKMCRKHHGRSKLYTEKHLSLFVSVSFYAILQFQVQKHNTLIVSVMLKTEARTHISKDAHRHTCTYTDSESQKWISRGLIAIAAVVTAPLLWSGWWQQCL